VPHRPFPWFLSAMLLAAVPAAAQDVPAAAPEAPPEVPTTTDAPVAPADAPVAPDDAPIAPDDAPLFEGDTFDTEEPAPAEAPDEASSEAPLPDETFEEEALFGFAADLEFSTAYVFRGLNLFGEKQADANGLLAPMLAITVPALGLTIGHWSAWQWSGNNIDANLRSGTGAEIDLWVGYDTTFLDDTLALSAMLLWYFYPAAVEEDAGTSLPAYVEPTVSLTWSGPVDLTLLVLYSAGVQDVFADSRYLYLRPSIGYSIDFGDTGSFDFELGFGYKLFHQDPVATADNVWDVQLDWAWNIGLGESGYLQPALHVAWTNLDGVVFTDEFVVWTGINLGVEI
jgi:hypothetical protein